jgi:hypothetical protein
MRIVYNQPVLVVDDFPTIARIVAQMLGQIGL